MQDAVWAYVKMPVLLAQTDGIMAQIEHGDGQQICYHFEILMIAELGF
jgi:hypothetical protein